MRKSKRFSYSEAVLKIERNVRLMRNSKLNRGIVIMTNSACIVGESMYLPSYVKPLKDVYHRHYCRELQSVNAYEMAIAFSSSHFFLKDGIAIVSPEFKRATVCFSDVEQMIMISGSDFYGEPVGKISVATYGGKSKCYLRYTRKL